MAGECLGRWNFESRSVSQCDVNSNSGKGDSREISYYILLCAVYQATKTFDSHWRVLKETAGYGDVKGVFI